MNYLLTVLCLVFTSLGLSAQNFVLADSIFPDEDELLTPSTDLLFLCRQSLEKDANAPIFLSEAWTTAVLVDYDNNAYQIESRYRIFDDEMQVQYEDQTKALFPQKIKAIRVGQMIFVPVSFETDGFETYGYFQILSDGKIMLLKRFEMSGGKIVERLYTKAENEPAQRLKHNRSCVMKVLKDEKSQLQLYTQQQGITFNDEKDLIRVFDYYNQL